MDESASGVTTLPSDFDPNSLWSNQNDALFDESLNSDDSVLPNPWVNDTSRTFAIEETEMAGESSSKERDTSQNPLGERDVDREESDSFLSELDSHSENDLDLPFEKVQEEPSGAPKRSAQIKNPSKPAEGTIRYDPFQGLPKINVLKDQFSASQFPKSNWHMVKILAILLQSSDTADSDKLFSLKEAMACLRWSHWKSALDKKYQSLIENKG